MSTREKISVVLVVLGLIMAFLPLRATRSLSGNPELVLSASLNDESAYTVDQVARFLVSEDSTIQLIDIRPADEFRKFSIPGAINVPYSEMLDNSPETFLLRGDMKNIFYSDGDLQAGYAVVLASGLGYGNVALMKGGMNEWINTVLNSTFSGGAISARENAIFEARTRAGKLFTEFNSLPDSLKAKYLDSKRFDPKKLDGGCE